MIADFTLRAGTWVRIEPLRAFAVAAGAGYIRDVVVTGDGQDEVGLLVFPRPCACRALAHLPADARGEVVLAAPTVRAFFQSYIDQVAAQATGSADRIVRLRLLAEPPSIERGEITERGMLDRRAVLVHRAADVHALYTDAVGTIRAGDR